MFRFRKERGCDVTLFDETSNATRRRHTANERGLTLLQRVCFQSLGAFLTESLQ